MCTQIVRYKHSQMTSTTMVQPISSSLGSHCGPRPFAYVNVATNDPSQVPPVTNDPLLGEDESFGCTNSVTDTYHMTDHAKLEVIDSHSH